MCLRAWIAQHNIRDGDDKVVNIKCKLTISFLELLNCGTHCHPLLSLNPTICHLLNLRSTNLILSPFLLKLSLIFSVFPLSGLCYRPYGLSPTLLTKKKIASGNIYKRKRNKHDKTSTANQIGLLIFNEYHPSK